jgi:hypothetical protein
MSPILHLALLIKRRACDIIAMLSLSVFKKNVAGGGDITKQAKNVQKANVVIDDRIRAGIMKITILHLLPLLYRG